MNRVFLTASVITGVLWCSCATAPKTSAPALTLKEARKALAEASSGWEGGQFAPVMALQGAANRIDRHEMQIGPCWTVSLDKRDFSYMAFGKTGGVFRSGRFAYSGGRWIAISDSPDYLNAALPPTLN